MIKRIIFASALVISLIGGAISFNKYISDEKYLAQQAASSFQEKTEGEKEFEVNIENRNTIIQKEPQMQLEPKSTEPAPKQEPPKSEAKPKPSAPKKQVVVSPAPKQTLPQTKPAVSQSRLIDTIKAVQNSQQVILVQSNTFKTERVTINTYEKVNGQWKEVLTNVSGFIGIGGFSTNRKEGDMTSPVGVFHMPYLFGWGGNPGYKMPYKPSTNDDFWLSVPTLAGYNEWVHRAGGPDPSWTKDQYEILGPDQKLYKYAAVMDFNMGAIKVIGKGSGIFLHINPTTGRGTAGCTSMPEDKLITTLKWLDPAKNPVIIQGPISVLSKM